MPYAMELHTGEIGVRMALGARPADVLRLAIGGGLRLVTTGAALGLAGALAVTRLITSVLYRVTPSDPVTIAAPLLLLVGATLRATWLPAPPAAGGGFPGVSSPGARGGAAAAPRLGCRAPAPPNADAGAGAERPPDRPRRRGAHDDPVWGRGWRAGALRDHRTPPRPGLRRNAHRCERHGTSVQARALPSRSTPASPVRRPEGPVRRFDLLPGGRSSAS